MREKQSFLELSASVTRKLNKNICEASVKHNEQLFTRLCSVGIIYE